MKLDSLRHFAIILPRVISRLLFSIFFLSISLSSAAAAENVLVIGLWPPANDLVRAHQGVQKDYLHSGYDFHFIAPKFENEEDPVGSGDFRVDYGAIFNDFMRITQELKPRAIFAFGASLNGWEMEYNYPPGRFTRWFQTGKIPTLVDTKLEFIVPESLTHGKTYHASFPLDLLEPGLEPLNRISPRSLDNYYVWVDRKRDAGHGVCGFLAYLMGWYHEQNPQSLGVLFTHVDGEKADLDRTFSKMMEEIAETLRRNAAVAPLPN